MTEKCVMRISGTLRMVSFQQNKGNLQFQRSLNRCLDSIKLNSRIPQHDFNETSPQQYKDEIHEQQSHFFLDRL